MRVHLLLSQVVAPLVVEEAELKVEAAVQVRQRSPCNESSRDQSLGTSSLGRLSHFQHI